MASEAMLGEPGSAAWAPSGALMYEHEGEVRYIPKGAFPTVLHALARDAGAVEVEIGEVGDTRIFYPEGSKQAEMGYNGFVVPDPGKYLVIPLEDE